MPVQCNWHRSDLQPEIVVIIKNQVLDLAGDMVEGQSWWELCWVPTRVLLVDRSLCFGGSLLLHLSPSNSFVKQKGLAMKADCLLALFHSRCLCHSALRRVINFFHTGYYAIKLMVASPPQKLSWTASWGFEVPVIDVSLWLCGSLCRRWSDDDGGHCLKSTVSISLDCGLDDVGHIFVKLYPLAPSADWGSLDSLQWNYFAGIGRLWYLEDLGPEGCFLAGLLQHPMRFRTCALHHTLLLWKFHSGLMDL